MTADALRKVVLVKALEDADASGEVLDRARRVAGTKVAGIGGEEKCADALTAAQEKRLESRAGELVSGLEGNAAAAGLLRHLGGGGRLGLVFSVVLLGAFAFGWAGNLFGKERIINVLAFPLMGLILWNLAVYLFMGFGAFAKRGEGEASGWLNGAVARWFAPKRGAAEEGGIVAEAERNYLTSWTRAMLPETGTLASMLFHLAAIALTLGLIVGMYVRGLGFEYKASWESTFLSADTVEKVLKTVLAPASALTGIDVPPGKAIANLAYPETDPAAPWIHLYAVTAALAIVVPRGIFAMVSFLKRRNLRNNAPLPDGFVPYYQSLIKSVSGAEQTVAVIPYGYAPKPRARDSVRAFLHQLWGGGVHVEFDDTLPYGDEEEVCADREMLPAYIVMLMNLTTTPEDETHGILMNSLKLRLGESPGAPDVLVLLDASRFREKLGALPEYGRRFDERKAAWGAVLKRHGISPAVFDSADEGGFVEMATVAEDLIWNG